MKIADILPNLNIVPLRRFADAWSVEVIKSSSADVFYQAILGQVDRIATARSVEDQLERCRRELDYRAFSNMDAVLRFTIDQPGYVVADEASLLQGVLDADASFHKYANEPNSLRHLEPRTVDIYQSVLQVAWEDAVSSEEYRLIERLRKNLGITRRDHHVLEIRTAGREPMALQDAEQGLKNLVWYGLVCPFKHKGNTQVVCPEEIALQVRDTYGIELQSTAYRNLAQKLLQKDLKEVLEAEGQPAVSLSKGPLIERLIDGDVRPSALLQHLKDRQLDELFTNFPDEKRPAMRSAKIRHLIGHFDRVSSVAAQEVVKSEDPDSTYFTYLEELASRQYDVLLAANVIQRDQNVDRFFERGVRYAFTNYLGHEPMPFKGSAHADGGVPAKNGRMALWDCKSALRPYSLNEAKNAQFLQYIHRETGNLVSPFLVFSGSFSPESAAAALMLKPNCPPGTEIGLMTAGDLKWLAENWNKDYPDKKLPLDVLAHTGLLDRETLEIRLKAFAAKAEPRS